MSVRLFCFALFLTVAVAGPSLADPYEYLSPLPAHCDPDSPFYNSDMTLIERIDECERNQMQHDELELLLREREWEKHRFSHWAHPIWCVDRIMDVRTFLAENPDPYSYEVVVIDDPGLRMYAAAVFDGQDWIFVFVPFEFRFEGPIQAGFWSDGVILILPDSEDGWHHRLKFDPFDPSGPQWWLHSIPPYSSP